jgi:hypothetical protein
MKIIILLICISFCVPESLVAQLADTASLIPEVNVSKQTSGNDSVKKVDLVDYLLKIFKVQNSKQKRDNQKVNFTLFPTTTSSGKTSFTSFNASFLLGGDETNTNRSTIYFYPYIGFGGQYGFDVQSFVWFPQNKWNFIGEYFMHKYPQETWGLGGNTPDSQATLVDYQHLRIHQKSMKEIWPHFSTGLGYALDYHQNISVEESEWDSLNYYLPYYKSRSVSSGILLPLLYDSRLNSANPKQGFMAALTFRFNSTWLGSDDNWQYMFLDARKYFPISRNQKKDILAIRGYYWTKLSGTAPYLDLPSVRWEPTPGQASRGIRQNRYKSNALIDLETEYRFGITANGFIGGVVFASLTSASEYESQRFLYWHPAGGTGLRMKFNKYSDINIAFDIAFSKEYFSAYLIIGEAF